MKLYPVQNQINQFFVPRHRYKMIFPTYRYSGSAETDPDAGTSNFIAHHESINISTVIEYSLQNTSITFSLSYTVHCAVNCTFAL